MKLARSFLAVTLALLLVVCPLLQPIHVSAADVDGKLVLSYRYGSNNLIQFNTNLPADTPCVNFTTGDNGCSIDESGNTVQWVGWIEMTNDNGTIVLTFHYNSAFTAGQSYVLPKGAVFGFTDGESYELDGDYTLTYDGSAWAMDVQNNVETFKLSYRYGTDNLIQLNTTLPSYTPCANFTVGDNGCNIDQSANQYQQVGWIGMENVDGTIVLTFHFNASFTAGQTYCLPAGGIFGFTDQSKYALDWNYTFQYDGSSWSIVKPDINLTYRYGTSNLIQFNTDLPANTPIQNFLATDNGCQILQSGNQQVGWIEMLNVDGTIVLTFHFNGEFKIGQSYTVSAGSVFGFTDEHFYLEESGFTYYWHGDTWSTTPHSHTEVIDAAVAAGCENTGLTEGSHCSVCGETIVAQEVVEALGHSYEAVVIAPTASKEGYTTYTCSVCGDSYEDDYVDAVGIGELKFCGASVLLQHDLTINYFVDANLFVEDAYTDPYVTFTVGNATETVTEYTVRDGMYIFACRHLSPSQVGDTMTATLYASLNGEQHSASLEYGVSKYCYAMLEQTEDTKLRTLLVDLLNYGAAAQNYTGYKKSALCNAALTDEQKAWGTSTVPAVTAVTNGKYATVENKKASWKGASLILDNSVTMRFRFAAESIENVSVKISAADGEWTITQFTAASGLDGQYYADFAGLTARQMRENVYVTVYEGDTAVSNTLLYSIESYAAAKQNDADADLVALLVAMIRYGDSAAAYLN